MSNYRQEEKRLDVLYDGYIDFLGGCLDNDTPRPVTDFYDTLNPESFLNLFKDYLSGGNQQESDGHLFLSEGAIDNEIARLEKEQKPSLLGKIYNNISDLPVLGDALDLISYPIAKIQDMGMESVSVDASKEELQSQRWKNNLLMLGDIIPILAGFYLINKGSGLISPDIPNTPLEFHGVLAINSLWALCNLGIMSYLYAKDIRYGSLIDRRDADALVEKYASSVVDITP